MQLTYRLASLCVLVILTGIESFYVYGQDTKKKFEGAGIVPDLIDVAPDGELQVKFSGGKKAQLGNILSQKDAEDIPEIQFAGEENSKYTLIMADPDAPAGTYLHWLVVNIPGDKVSRGDIRTDYAGPTPPQGSGTHRYVLLVYKQSSVMSRSGSSKRGRFDLRKFVSDNQLGDPLFGNFYRVKAQ